MTEFNVSLHLMAAGAGALIAVYVILALLLGLGIFALVRLAILVRMNRKQQQPKAGEAPDCASCEKLAEKEKEVASLQEEKQADEKEIAALKEQEDAKDREIADLQQKIKELEAAAAASPAVIPVVVPAEERSLSESLAAASAVGSKGVISKKSIIAYLSQKYGDKLELNGRPNRTPNGKLLLSDNHFGFAPDGKRVCFTYVYETDDGNVVSLIKLDAPYVQDMLAKHPEVRHSAFPKNKAKDWYSVVADSTFTEQGYYDVLDHAISLITGEVVAPVAAPAEEPAPEVSLKESLAAAKESGVTDVVSKKSIIEHLAATFGDKVELNGRENRTPNGKLLLSDNHFAFAPDGKRVCFAYVYEDEGNVTVLLRTTKEHAKDIHSAHPATGVKSAFPKNKEKDWYSMVVDSSFTAANVYYELDRAAANIIGIEIASPAPAEEPAPEVSLKESLAAAKESGVTDVVNKKSIIEHLAATFGDKVELNGRENRTPNGKLLLSDNHFAFAPDGKRVCFAYVYEDEGNVTVLLRTTKEHAGDIHAAHPSTGIKSAFPKNKEKDWYSMVVDGSFTAANVFYELDRAAANIIGIEIAPVAEPTPAPAEEKPAEEVSLKESLEAAKETGATGIVDKKAIRDHLALKFEGKVELNGRENRTPNGKLLLSDNHFAFAPDGKRVCFAYVYEDEGNVTILLRTTEEHARVIHLKHPQTGIKSAFPKNKERDWYSVVVDKTFTKAGVFAELDRAAMNIIGADAAPKTEAPAPAEEPAEEVSLKASLAAAKDTGAVGIVTKKTVIDYLSAKYGDKVELNGRENRTPNGKLLLSDNHFAVDEGKRVCFTYIYEDAGRIVILLRASSEAAAAIHAAHAATGVKSAFPKNKDKDWYSVVVDDSFTQKDVEELLDASYAYVLSK